MQDKQLMIDLLKLKRLRHKWDWKSSCTKLSYTDYIRIFYTRHGEERKAILCVWQIELRVSIKVNVSFSFLSATGNRNEDQVLLHQQRDILFKSKNWKTDQQSQWWQLLPMVRPFFQSLNKLREMTFYYEYPKVQFSDKPLAVISTVYFGFFENVDIFILSVKKYSQDGKISGNWSIHAKT